MTNRAASIGTRNAAKRVAVVSSPPWKTDAKWKRIRTRHGRAIRFIETYCRPPKGLGFGKPLKLAEEQKNFLEEALADGIDVAVKSMPRGNGKSTEGGALATWATFDDDEWGAPQVPIIATTIGQAIRSCYGVAVSMIKNEPELLSRSLIYTGIATPRVSVPFNEGELFPISNDPDGLQGLDFSFSLIDEIGFQPPDSFDAVRMAQGKRPRSLIMGVGTPGVDHENALYRLRATILESGVPKGVVFREYAAPDGCAVDDREAWRIANPALRAGYLRESALETDLGITHEGEFRIFRLGQWVEGTDSWLGGEGQKVWEGLTSPWDFVEDGPTWLGVDIGIKRDSSAVVAVQMRPDGRYHAVAKIWTPTKDDPVDVTDVMRYIRELDSRYDLQAVSFDPRFFDVPAKMLEDEGMPVLEVPQSPERMTPACGDLYEAILSGKLTHDGDAEFGHHILAAVARYNDRGFVLSKGKSRGRIDATIALALAMERALRTEPDYGPLVATGSNW